MAYLEYTCTSMHPDQFSLANARDSLVVKNPTCMYLDTVEKLNRGLEEGYHGSLKLGNSVK